MHGTRELGATRDGNWRNNEPNKHGERRACAEPNQTPGSNKRHLCPHLLRLITEARKRWHPAMYSQGGVQDHSTTLPLRAHPQMRGCLALWSHACPALLLTLVLAVTTGGPGFQSPSMNAWVWRLSLRFHGLLWSRGWLCKRIERGGQAPTCRLGGLTRAFGPIQV